MTLAATLLSATLAMLSFALFIRNVSEHVGGPVTVVFGAGATVGSLAFIAAVVVGVVQ